MVDVDLPNLYVVLSDHVIYVDRSKHMMIAKKRMFLYNCRHVNEKQEDKEIKKTTKIR